MKLERAARHHLLGRLEQQPDPAGQPRAWCCSASATAGPDEAGGVHVVAAGVRRTGVVLAHGSSVRSSTGSASRSARSATKGPPAVPTSAIRPQGRASAPRCRPLPAGPPEGGGALLLAGQLRGARAGRGASRRARARGRRRPRARRNDQVRTRQSRLPEGCAAPRTRPAGTYTPQTSRSALQTSPTVALARSASFIGNRHVVGALGGGLQRRQVLVHLVVVPLGAEPASRSACWASMAGSTRSGS